MDFSFSVLENNGFFTIEEYLNKKGGTIWTVQCGIEKRRIFDTDPA